MRRARTGDSGAFAATDLDAPTGAAPGKRAPTDALPRSSGTSARPSAFAAAPVDGAAPDLSYDSLFGVSSAQLFGNAKKGSIGAAATDAAATVAAKSEPLTAADFADIDVPWNIAEKRHMAPVGNDIDLHIGQINNYGAAELKPGVDAARGAGYTLGFVQTLRATNRVSIYSENEARADAYDKRHDTIHDEHVVAQGKGSDHEEPGADVIEAGHKKHKAKAPEYQRLVLKGGPLLDTLTGPSPWYDGSQNIPIGGDEAMITDHPRVTSPRTTPDGAATLSRMEGKDSFLTNFVAMPPGGGAPIYLAHATWAISYTGEFDRALSHFHGGNVTVSAEGKGKGGSPVLTGSPANTAIGNSATWSDPKKK